MQFRRGSIRSATKKVNRQLSESNHRQHKKNKKNPDAKLPLNKFLTADKNEAFCPTVAYNRKHEPHRRMFGKKRIIEHLLFRAVQESGNPLASLDPIESKESTKENELEMCELVSKEDAAEFTVEAVNTGLKKSDGEAPPSAQVPGAPSQSSGTAQ